MCPVWSLLIPNLQYKLHTNAGLLPQAPVAGGVELVRTGVGDEGVGGAHEGGGRAQGGWALPLPRDLLTDPPTCTPSLLGFFPSKNEFREVSGQLDSV